MSKQTLAVLKEYVQPLSAEQRDELAAACGTTWGHLRNVIYGDRRCTPELAIALERTTEGALTCETLCPDFDWAYLRGATPAASDAST